MGDANLSGESMLLNFDAAAFIQSFMANINSEEDPDGSLVDCTPSVRFSGRPGDPSWTSAFIELGLVACAPPHPPSQTQRDRLHTAPQVPSPMAELWTDELAVLLPPLLLLRRSFVFIQWPLDLCS